MIEKPLKKILLFTRPLAPPWDEASKNLAYEIAKNSSGSFLFELLTTKNYRQALFDECNNSPLKKINALPIYENYLFGKKEKSALLKKLLLADNSTDIIHFLFAPRKLTSLLIKAKLLFLKTTKTIQTVATIQDELCQNKKKLQKVLFADKIIAQSFFTKNKLAVAGMDNVSVVYPGIDLEKFQPQPKDESFLADFGLKKEDFIVLYAGEYDRLEAMENIFEAIEIVIKKNNGPRRIKFVMACRIKNKKDLEIKQVFIEKTKKRGYDKNIVFVDFCPEMAKLYNAVDIQIFPVKKMAGKFDIPFVLIEQMACKKPIIVSDLDVLKEFVQDQKNGMVVKKDSPSQLANAILALFQDRQLLEQLGNSAFKYVHENFNIKKNIKKYDEIYENLSL